MKVQAGSGHLHQNICQTDGNEIIKNVDLDEAFPNTQRKQLTSEPITDHVLFEMLQHIADHKLDRDYVL